MHETIQQNYSRRTLLIAGVGLALSVPFILRAESPKMEAAGPMVEGIRTGLAHHELVVETA